MELKTIIVWLFIGIFFLVMTNLAFAHCIKRDFKTKGQKILWCSVSLFPFLGFFIYFIFGSRKGNLKR